MVLLVPMIPNLDLTSNLIAASTYTRNVINQPISSFLFSTNEVIYTLSTPKRRRVSLHDKICCSLSTSHQKISYPKKISLSFLSLIAPLPHPSSYKSLSFCTTPWSILLVARLDTEQIMNGLVKPTRSSNLPG